jgi:hypothetical protein
MSDPMSQRSAETVRACECGFSTEVCATNPCYRKQAHLAGLTPGSKWPDGAPIGTAPAKNTDREIWRGPDEGGGDFYADSLHVTKDGALGINCGGSVYVKPIREWHRLAGGPITGVAQGSLGQFAADFAAKQQPLGEEFAKVLAETPYATMDAATSSPAVDSVSVPISVIQRLRERLEHEDSFVWLDEIQSLDAALSRVPSTDREYDPNVAPCDDAEFGMKP